MAAVTGSTVRSACIMVAFDSAGVRVIRFDRHRFERVLCSDPGVCLHGRGRQARICHAGPETEQPQQQHACGPAAELSAMEEHGW